MSIINQGVTVRDLRTFLIGLPAFSHGKQEVSLLSTNKLNAAIDVNDIFILLQTEYASFLNYRIFKKLQEKYVADKGQEELQYPDLLKEYIDNQISLRSSLI